METSENKAKTIPGESSLPQRRSIRLPEYDYSQPGAYFITLSTFNRESILGEIIGDADDGSIQLTDAGRALIAVWRNLPKHYPYIRHGEMAVMPDHFHGIVYIKYEPNGKRQPLSEIVRAFKSFSARRINAIRQTPGKPVWQRGYFERVIRDEEELWNTILYIRDNPRKWKEDRGENGEF